MLSNPILSPSSWEFIVYILSMSYYDKTDSIVNIFDANPIVSYPNPIRCRESFNRFIPLISSTLSTPSASKIAYNIRRLIFLLFILRSDLINSSVMTTCIVLSIPLSNPRLRWTQSCHRLLSLPQAHTLLFLLQP